MENQKPYQKYIPLLKTQCVSRLIANAALLIALLLLIFVPHFRIDLNSVPEEVLLRETTLPKLLTLDILVNPVIDFSLWDEIYAAFTSGLNFAISLPMIYFLIFFIWGIISNIISIVRVSLKLSNLDDYALLSYDGLRDPVGIKSIQNKVNMASGIYAVGMSLIGLGLHIAIPFFEKGSDTVLHSYFALITGATEWVVFTSLFIIAFIIAVSISISAWNKMKISVLRESYNSARAEARANLSQPSSSDSGAKPAAANASAPAATDSEQLSQKE